MQMKLKDLPQEFVDMYNRTKIVEINGNGYIKIQKGLYGLPQAGILAQQQLDQRLNEHGYQQSPLTPGFWNHETQPISFTLCVDDFGEKYVVREHAEHLLQVLNANYKCAIDWEGNKYLGMNIDWYYEQNKVLVSMLKYVPEALAQFWHKAPQTLQHQPYPHVRPTYGATCQYTELRICQNN